LAAIGRSVDSARHDRVFSYKAGTLVSRQSSSKP
jgi:hypothetical protein